MSELEDLRKQKDQAYWERNQLVAALSKIYPAWLEYHAEEEEGWRWLIFIEIPTKELEMKYIQGGFEVKHKRQVAWHISNKEMVDYFGHVKTGKGRSWDGHDTPTKYDRLRNILGKNDRNWLVRLFMSKK